jgi:hypothetical protein
MNRRFVIYSTKLVLSLCVATVCAVLNPATMSAQTSGTGGDGYTRVLWQGADSSIQVWLLDPNLNYVAGVTEGPYEGWIPVALAVGDDSYTRIMWRSTEGELALWLLYPNLDFYSSTVYGPYPGWLPETTSVDSNGYERVVWRNTNGALDVWELTPGQILINSVGYTNGTFGYVPAGSDAAPGRGLTTPGKGPVPDKNERAGRPAPKVLTPQLRRLTAPPRRIE